MPVLTNNQEFENWRNAVGWESGYYKHRPLSAIKNQSSNNRDIVNSAKGYLKNSTIPVDIIEVHEKELLSTGSSTRELRIISPNVFPRILLNRRANDTLRDDTVDNLVAWPSNYKLEGNFHDYFDIMHENGKEEDVLKILSPDIMSILIDLPNQLDVEFTGNSIILYFRSGFANLELSYSIQTLLYYGSLLASKLINNSIEIPAIEPDFKTKLSTLYQSSTTHKIAYGLKEFTAISIVYLAILGFIFISFNIYKNQIATIIFLLISAGIYILMIMHYLKRISKNIHSS